MHVDAEANVVCQIPAVVIGIGVDHDVVRGPIPLGAIVIIVGSDAEIEALEPKARAVSAFDSIDVAAANGAREMAVLPRVIQLVVRIVATGGMANPLPVAGVDVRRLWMAALVAIIGSSVRRRRVARLGWMRRLPDRCWTPRRNVTMTYLTALLRR